MMDKDIDLDALFAEARTEETVLGPDLTARLLADARAAQPQPRPAPQRRPGLGHTLREGLRALSNALGGPAAIAGLSLAGVTGIFLGAVQPSLVTSVTASLSGTTATTEQLDMLPASTIWTED